MIHDGDTGSALCPATVAIFLDYLSETVSKCVHMAVLGCVGWGASRFFAPQLPSLYPT